MWINYIRLLKNLKYSKRYVSDLFLIDKQANRQTNRKDSGILQKKDAFCTQYNASSLVSYLAEAAIFEKENSIIVPDVADFSKHCSRLNWD